MSATSSTLIDFLAASALRSPNAVAVEDLSDGSLTYAEFDALTDRVRDRLRQLGVRRGDRVGVYLRKSIDAYAVMIGTMKAGGAYVPVDVGAPAWRSAFILSNCTVKVVVLDADVAEPWRAETEKVGEVPSFVVLESVGGGRGLVKALDALDAVTMAEARRTESLQPDELAYILYTSGSTGKPKGVMLSHRNAVAYVDWCSMVFTPTEQDRFSSHAPFHFDLSILDLYVPLKHGAAVVLIDAEQGKAPLGLALLIAERRLTVWYSTPTILTLLAQSGRMERHDYSTLRVVLFAGEVFPAKHLREVKGRLPRADFYNLYGPTETNVCTYHRIPTIVERERSTPYPIGRVCEHLRARVTDVGVTGAGGTGAGATDVGGTDVGATGAGGTGAGGLSVDGMAVNGTDVAAGEEGELVIEGDNVMLGYWDLPERSANAFYVDGTGARWYRTGDVVAADADGVFTFIGRRDRMIKRRGYRIELGEVEAGLYRHPGVREAAAVVVPDADGAPRIKAILALGDGVRGSVIAMKRFCASTLPAYMIPDLFVFVDALPKTSTDKVDYQRLQAEV